MSEITNPIGSLAPMNENDLRDLLMDGPRAGLDNPSPDEIQRLLEELHDDMGDRDPEWSSDAP